MRAVNSSAVVLARCIVASPEAQAALAGHTSSQSASILAARSLILCAQDAAFPCSKHPHPSKGSKLRVVREVEARGRVEA